MRVILCIFTYNLIFSYIYNIYKNNKPIEDHIIYIKKFYEIWSITNVKYFHYYIKLLLILTCFLSLHRFESRFLIFSD